MDHNDNDTQHNDNNDSDNNTAISTIMKINKIHSVNLQFNLVFDNRGVSLWNNNKCNWYTICEKLMHKI